ncbi:MAG: FAD-dependent oxidoreductase [bacterium]|nr:FAD-dependent oxidoreductase [bacterium]
MNQTRNQTTTIRPKIAKLVQNILGSKIRVHENTPGYYALDCLLTDELADVALKMKLRVPTTAKKLAKKCGKSVDETYKLLMEMAEIGVIEITKQNDDKELEEFCLPIFIPGSMEIMVANKEQVEKFPQVAKAFEKQARGGASQYTPLMPVGAAPMRVIPIEQTISAESKTATYEQLSYWLKKYDVFAVGDCVCRKTRRLMGEGCGHLEEDVCIAVGEMAKYLVRTNRGRMISYEETLGILKKAEENGLVHQISNVDGNDKIWIICNCCTCSCLGLRLSQYYGTPNLSRSNFAAEIDTDKCVGCGECVEYCPANAAKLGQSICSKTPVDIPKALLPDDNKWGPDKFNPDYRTNRKNVVETGTAPCKTECPAHIAVQGYVKLASQGQYTDALALIKKENPLPAICGRICPRKCESECTRGDIDEPVAVDEIKKFIAEQDLNKEVRYIPPKINDYGKSIAIIGSGPAGLSCAYFLAVDGYKVTVFEKEEKLGGMLTLGIPSFRLEKDVINAEIDILREMGVEFKTGVEVGKDITLDQLRNQGFEAFYLAIGAQGSRAIGIEGEDAEGVLSGVDFLRDINLEKNPEIKGRVIVIGGGNAAIDVARSAIRLNTGSVNMYCLESKKEMPALEEEIEEALEENITINNSRGPKRILSKNGRVTGVEFMKCISVFDDHKKFNPVYDENNTITVEADYVLIAVGQAIDWGNLIINSSVELNNNNTAIADPFTYQTNEEDVFVGGDVYTGPKFAIDAIAAGKEAAISIHRFVWPGQSLTIGRNKREFHSLDRENIIVESCDNTPRQKTGHSPEDSKAFKDTRLAFTEEQIKKETERCLSCGVSFIDDNICLGCGVCAYKCKFDAITLTKKFNAPNIPYEQLPRKVIAHALKRQVKIAVKTVKNKIGLNK